MPLDEGQAAENMEQAKEKTPRQAKEKKSKKEKAPKQKKSKGAEKPKKEKKPLTAGKAALATALVFLLLMGGVAGAVVTDVGGTREALATMLQGGTEAAKSEKELELMATEQDQAQKEKELAEREKALNSQQIVLDKKEKELDARDELLLQTEQDAVSSQQSLAQLAEVYSRMEASSAAGILSEIKNKQDITDILMQMKQNKVADILAAMTPELASEITLLMKSTAAVTATATPTTTE
jgi:flagellar motility protein MotE (MotC chaperone)